MSYPIQLIREIIDSLDHSIEEFFHKYKGKCKLNQTIFEYYVSEVLSERFQNNTREDKLAPLALKVTKSKNDKKRYLYNTYINSYLGIPVTSKDHPFYFMTQVPENMYVNTFGNRTIEDFIEEHRDNCDIWREDVNALLTAFPGIEYLKPSAIRSALELDIIIGSWRYIKTELNGDIGSFNVTYPGGLIDKPILAGKPFKEEFTVNPHDSSVIEKIIKGEDGEFILALQTDADKKEIHTKALSSEAKAALSTIVNHVDDIKQFAVDHRIQIPLRKIAEADVDYSINSFHLEKAKNLLAYLFDFRLITMDPEDANLQEGWDRILSSVHFFGTGDKEWADIKVGDQIAADIVNRRLVQITRKSYEMLESSYSKILSHCLKKEQLVKNATDENRTGKYEYSFFLRNVRFETANKKKNIAIIKASLQEFVDNQIIIEKFVLKDDVFLIKFLPLTESEIMQIESMKDQVL